MNTSNEADESERLLSLSDSFINQERGTIDLPLHLEIIAYVLHCGMAIVGALVPAWVASTFVGTDNGVLVFCALLVLIGCVIIAHATTNTSYWHAKQFDAINALRLVILDQTNRLSNIGERK